MVSIPSICESFRIRQPEPPHAEKTYHFDFKPNPGIIELLYDGKRYRLRRVFDTTYMFLDGLNWAVATIMKNDDIDGTIFFEKSMSDRFIYHDDCFVNRFKKSRTMKIGILTDMSWRKKYGVNHRRKINQIVGIASAITQTQFNFKIRIRKYINNSMFDTCQESIFKGLDLFKTFKKPKFLAHWHYVTDCYPKSNVVGLAYVGAVCNRNRYNIAISTDTWDTEATFIHEVGHIIGAKHGKNGIMGSGFPLRFHFNRKSEICPVINSKRRCMFHKRRLYN